MILRWTVLLLLFSLLFGIKPNSLSLKGDDSSTNIEDEGSEKKVTSVSVKGLVITFN